MKRVIMLAGLIAVSMMAGAQTAPTATAKLSYTAPTTNTDNSAIAGALSYNVYMGAKGGAKSKVATGIAGLSYTRANVPMNSCFTVTAVNAAGAESAQSSEVCIAVPNAPTNLTVTVTVSVETNN